MVPAVDSFAAGAGPLNIAIIVIHDRFRRFGRPKESKDVLLAPEMPGPAVPADSASAIEFIIHSLDGMLPRLPPALALPQYFSRNVQKALTHQSLCIRLRAQTFENYAG